MSMQGEDVRVRRAIQLNEEENEEYEYVVWHHGTDTEHATGHMEEGLFFQPLNKENGWMIEPISSKHKGKPKKTHKKQGKPKEKEPCVNEKGNYGPFDFRSYDIKVCKEQKGGSPEEGTPGVPPVDPPGPTPAPGWDPSPWPAPVPVLP